MYLVQSHVGRVMELLIGLAIGLWWAHHRMRKYREQVVVALVVHEAEHAVEQKRAGTIR